MGEEPPLVVRVRYGPDLAVGSRRSGGRRDAGAVGGRLSRLDRCVNRLARCRAWWRDRCRHELRARARALEGTANHGDLGGPRASTSASLRFGVKILQSGVYEADPVKRGAVFNEAYDWYQNNCLYLTEDARDGFRRMYFAAHIHQAMVDAGFGDKKQTEKIEENWEKIVSLDRALIEGAGGHVSDAMLRELRREHEQRHKDKVRRVPVGT
jgi:hypothetical protein